MKYSILYCDPAWDYAGREQHNTQEANKSVIHHYRTMKIDDMKKLKVQDITEDDALMFMWSSSPHLPQAIELMKHWGFEYKTIAFVWDKQRVNPGYYTMSQCEVCLVGKKGRIPSPRGAKNVKQFLSKMRSRHSEKPTEVRDRITQMFPTQSKIELFARQKTEGWDVWGNEVESSIVSL